MSYATITELKNRLNITTTDTTRDSVLAGLLDAASEAINGLCNRPDGFVAVATATARYFYGNGARWQRIDECVSVSSVAVKDSPTDTTYTAWTSPTTNFSNDGDWIAAAGSQEFPEFNRLPYTLLLVDPSGDNGVFTSGRFTGRAGFRPDNDTGYRNLPTVKVTARWGYAESVPPQVREATIVQASRWWKRGESGWADSIANGDMGALQFRKSIDPDVKAMLIEARLVKVAIG